MSTGTATAPLRAPRRTDPAVKRATPGGRTRGHLRSIDLDAPAPRGRTRVHVVLGTAVGVLFSVLFAVAVLQTVLVQGQIHLDGLQAELAEAEVQVQVLRAEVGQLESPGRVTAAAEAAGMVRAEQVNTVVPQTAGGPTGP